VHDEMMGINWSIQKDSRKGSIGKGQHTQQQYQQGSYGGRNWFLPSKIL
jgi:hypothetical protein